MAAAKKTGKAKPTHRKVAKGRPAAKGVTKSYSPKRNSTVKSTSLAQAAPKERETKPAIFTSLQWGVLAILALVQFMHIVDFMVIMPLAKKFEELFRITTNQFGWLVSAYTLAAFASGIAATFFIDRISRKASLMIGFMGFIAGNLLCAAAPGFYTFLAARFVTGAFGGLLSGVTFSIIGDLIEPAKRGRATGVIMMAFSVAAVIGVPAGIWLANGFFLQLPYYLIAFGSALILIFAWLRMPPLKDHLFGPRMKVMSQIRAVLKSDKHQRLYLMMVFHFMAGFSIIPYIAGFMQKNNSVTDEQLPLIYLTGGIATIVSSPVVGWLSDKFGNVRIYSFISLLASIPFVLVTYEWTKSFALLLTSTVLFFIFVSGRMVPAMALLNNTVSPAHRGTFMSLNGSVQQLAMSLGAIAASFIIYAPPGQPIQHYAWVGVFGIVFNIAAIWVANTFKSR
jgi:DHA1 family inner membrane transport protein